MNGGRAQHRLAEVLAALSLASDLGLGAPLERGLRLSLVSSRLADLAGLKAGDRRDFYYPSFLIMLGCTSSSAGQADLFGDEFAVGQALSPLVMGPPSGMARWLVRNIGTGQPPLRRARKVAYAMTHAQAEMKEGNAGHCEVARILALRLGLATPGVEFLDYVFERWDGRGGPAGIKGESIPIQNRIGAVAYDLVTQIGSGLTDQAAFQRVREHAGHGLDPSLVELLRDHQAELQEAVHEPAVWDAVLAAEPRPYVEIDEAGLDRAAEVVADFADLKSLYTRGHSRGVAALAAGAAELLGLAEAERVELRRAALIHDLGRVAVPAGVWERRGSLTDSEWEQVRLHAHWTERVLGRLPALAGAARTAGLHHERLDGSGYHRSATAAALSLPARILAAADVCHALAEERPHRPPLEREAATALLGEEVRAGRLDARAVEAVGTAAGLAVKAPRPAAPADLTPRELEVARLVARGLATKQVAAALGISAKTADHHLQNVYGKTGVHTRAGVAVFAMEQGLL